MIDQSLKGDLDLAVAFLLRHARNPNDNLRQAKDKFQKRLRSGIDRGDLPPQPFMIVADEKIFPAPEFVAWARTKFPAHFSQFAALVTGHATSGFKVGATVTENLVPGDIQLCQAALMEAQRAIGSLRDESRVVLAEFERLRLIEAKYAYICEKNRRNARKPRKQ